MSKRKSRAGRADIAAYNAQYLLTHKRVRTTAVQLRGAELYQIHKADPVWVAKVAAQQATPEQRERRRKYEAGRYQTNPARKAANMLYNTTHKVEKYNYDQQHQMMINTTPTRLAKKMCQSAKRRAKLKGVPFNITSADIEIPTHCPILGQLLYLGGDRRIGDNPSLDRIIPELGYVRGNIAVISHRANGLKRNGTAEQFRRIAMYVDTRGNMLEPQVI